MTASLKSQHLTFVGTKCEPISKSPQAMGCYFNPKQACRSTSLVPSVSPFVQSVDNQCDTQQRLFVLLDTGQDWR